MIEILLLLGLYGISAQICDVTNDPEVKHFDLHILEIEVPDDITTYVCQQFSVPSDTEYHAVAFEPLIDNHEVMHHMLLFGCPHDIGVDGPHECGAVDNRCPSWIAQWTMGVQGQVCAHPGTGIRFGKDSFAFMALQIHWNNAQRAQNLTDRSGMRVYYTSKLRHHDAGNVQIGQTDLEIPPGSTNHSHSGGCSGTCTRNLLPHSIYLTRTYIHMHFLGVRGLFEVYRNGELVHTVAADEDYEYQLSPIHVHQQPIEVKPGDEMRLTCVFDTTTDERHRNHTIYYGEGSDAEMCFAFVTYYPRVESLDQCVQFDHYDVCGPTRGSSYGDCRMMQFGQEARGHLIPAIVKSCRNIPEYIDCASECPKQLQTLSTHPCMEGRLKSLAVRTILSQINNWNHVNRLVSMNNCTTGSY